MRAVDGAETEEKKYLLIVEDDESVAEGVKDILTGYHYRVAWTENIADTLKVLEREKVDLLILDVNLDGESGYELCRKVRESWDLPILFLTGCSSEMELIRGFQAGGDDYVTKPFRMQELLVRIQALLRRAVRQKNAVVKSGGLVYDGDRKVILNENGKVELTATELKIAEILIENWPRTITREELLYGVWDYDGVFVAENTLNVNISRLREKLGVFDENPYIETVRGIGYRWAVPVRR